MQNRLILQGGDAYSLAQQKKLLQQWIGVAPLTQFTARFFYLLELKEALTSQEIAQLERLLQADRGKDWAAAPLYVLPRLGTISPWASKALDILQLCALNKISRIERGIAYHFTPASAAQSLTELVHDRMTESVIMDSEVLSQVFTHSTPRPIQHIAVLTQGLDALKKANQSLGLALAEDEMHYLLRTYTDLKRNPTDAELMMFAQVNSEHCRHKIFRSTFVIDGHLMPHSLFDMIKNTYQQHPHAVLSAYKDNAAVMAGNKAARLYPDTAGIYHYHKMDAPILMKVETHNHPTAIAPFAGAATGAGGEIRDEGAVGRGAKPKAGLVGFSVSHLRIPNFPQAFEGDLDKPDHIASALHIMIEGPIGAARYNNEFGRPHLCGYFRSYEQQLPSKHGVMMRAYHKPIMIAGGMGLVRPDHVQKQIVPEDSLIIILGGPSFIIGLGGGSASSVAAGSGIAALDFASVQRDNAQMQRLCQEVIDRCWALGEDNPILSIHDVGAGGLSNAVPEILHDAGRGGDLNIRALDLGDPSLSPMEIWCNESQERYVLAISPDKLAQFSAIAKRERCPFSVLGKASLAPQLQLKDPLLQEAVVDMPMTALFTPLAKMQRSVERAPKPSTDFALVSLALKDNLESVLQHPTVADKSFLITIGDRSVGGLSSRDQMVGPWQVPVADVAVTLTDFVHDTGEAMAMGERTPLAVINAPASGRMAVAEAITNMAAAPIDKISDIKLSANWMAAGGFADDDADLYDTVQAVGMELCPALGICIPVGKDSLSMRMVWQRDGAEHQAVSPVSLVVSAFAPVLDVRRTLTPELDTTQESELLLIDLGRGKNRMGASILAQVHNTLGEQVPDLDNALDLKNFFAAIQALNAAHLLLAYHDRSDGGVWTSLCEMAFAAHCGLDIHLDADTSALSFLCNEELGAVIQIKRADSVAVWALLKAFELADCSRKIAQVNALDTINIYRDKEKLATWPRVILQQHWSRVSYEMRQMRDNALCAAEEYAHILNTDDPGLSAQLCYEINANIAAPFLNVGAKPKVAILREQGVNGQIEMAYAFDAAGFSAVDVHMSDILNGQQDLTAFHGLVACGGFSYGDVLGAGRGWANTILYHEQTKHIFEAFFLRKNTFTLGVCNGCQMFAALKDLLPGAKDWPTFTQNFSEQFEARVVRVEVLPTPSIFLTDMVGSKIPIIVSHGEGRVELTPEAALNLQQQHQLALRYVDNQGLATQRYPFNPNGSEGGIAALTNTDGRITIMMPHPERMTRALQCSWRDKNWTDASPWRRMFENARVWVGKN